MQEAHAGASRVNGGFREPARSSPTPEVIGQIERAIDSFNRVNTELAQELALLCATLSQTMARPDAAVPDDVATVAGIDATHANGSSLCALPPSLLPFAVNGSESDAKIKTPRWAQRSRREH